MPTKAELKNKVLAKKVEDASVKAGMSVLELFEQYSKMGGFGSRNLAEALEILEAMCNDKDSVNFLSFTADLIATGLRGVIAQLVATGKFKVLITTCGTLDHDIARALGAKYAFGSFDVDDSKLRSIGVSRLGNIFLDSQDYGVLTEKFVHSVLEECSKIKKKWGVRELVEKLAEKLPNDKNSVLKAAHTTRSSVYVPGFVDGAVGTHVFTYSQTHEFAIDPLKDLSELSGVVFEAKRTGALVIGGGISKHHTIWWNQFKGGLDYAVYLTTATEYDGSLSGARTKEAISWNKLKPKALHTTVLGDATITLPLLTAALLSKSR